MFLKSFILPSQKLTNKNEQQWCKELFKLSKGEVEKKITKIKLKRKVKLEM